MIEKIISNSFEFNEPTIQPLYIEKRATTELDKYIEKLETSPGRTKLLILALGAGEYYGCNRNGDYFPERALIDYHKTFEVHGHNYKHHINKNPEKSYGKVIFSYYNNKMKRVELVVDVDNSKVPDIIQKAEADELIPVSMACRVPYDICSICGNKAKNTGEYCEHLKTQMTQILSSGKQVYAINTQPVFFDISYVFRPADRTAYVLSKVASVTNPVKSMNKSALLSKLSEIEKKIEGHAFKPALEKALPNEDIPEDVLSTLKKYKPEVTLRGLSDKGIVLSIPDFFKILLPESEVTDDDVKCIRGNLSFKNLEDEFDLPEQIIPDELSSLIEKIKNKFSLFPDIAEDRALSLTFKRPSKARIILGPSSFGFSSSSGGGKIIIKKAAKLADIYNSYKFACVKTSGFSDNDLFLSLVVSQR